MTSRRTQDAVGRRAAGAQLRASLSFGRIGAGYLLIVTIVLFSLLKPGIFPHFLTFASILNAIAIPGLLAVGLIFPLAAGVFDLSVGYTLGVATIVTAKLLASGSSLTVTVVVAVLVSIMVGVLNGVVVVLFKIDSFIGTLATGSLLFALIIEVSDNQQIVENLTKVQSLVAHNANHVTLPVFVFVAVAFAAAFVLELTVFGRHIYATGLGKEQARLAGLPTARLQFISLVVCALLAGVAGVLLTGIIGAGSPDVGPPYLIPAFAAAFLGATQFKDGLFNVAGTVLAILLLATINEGLAETTSALWAPYLFNGLVLITALGLRVLQARQIARRKLAERWDDDSIKEPAEPTKSDNEAIGPITTSTL